MLTDLGKKTTIATLYQAGENLYNHFDKVCVLDHGLQVYFGPTSEAIAYFEDLGYLRLAGQTSAEFLTTITDPETRKARPGTQAEKIRSPNDLAEAFKHSQTYQQLVQRISSIENRSTSSVLPTDSYKLSYPQQIFECVTREYQLFRAMFRVYVMKLISTVILAITVGSEYFSVSTDTSGVTTKGGVFFYAVLLNGWFYFPELFYAHTNRPVLERQASLNLYRPSAVAIARVLLDLPLIAFQTLVFMVCYYFLVRLRVDGGGFFFMYFTIFLTTNCWSNLLRMFAYYVPSLDDCKLNTLNTLEIWTKLFTRFPVWWNGLHSLRSFLWLPTTCT